MGKYFSLTFYEKNRQEGELWVRTPNNSIVPAQEALSEVFLKYKNVSSELSEQDSSGRTIYQDLMEGNFFLRFDMIQDVLFVETPRGNIFDQIVVENNKILPRNQDNNFTTSLLSKRLTFPDYYFDENNKKIYIVTNKIEEYENLNGLKLGYIIEEFDMNSSVLDVKYYFKVFFNFNIKNFYKILPIVEPLKLSYNRFTKTFNISHICRGPNNEFGLVSINVLKDQNLNVNSINAFFPFQDTTDVDYESIIQKKLTIDLDL
jgi:hypothetical protein